MSFDGHANFAYSTVAVAPSPALSGTTLTVQTGDGAKMPAVPFDAPVWPAGTLPLTTNAEILRVTNVTGDVLIFTRQAESSGNRSIVAGDQIAVCVTAKTLTDIESAATSLKSATSTITTTGTQTALAIPSGTGPLVIFANNATILTLQGIAAGLDGQKLSIFSIGAGQVDFVHQSGSATAANRLVNFATSGNTSLAPGVGGASFIYDATASRWRLVEHEQGDWITPAFSAGNYTASASTWTVTTGEVTDYKYYLRGRALSFLVNVALSSVGGGGLELRVAIPGGFTAAMGDIFKPAVTNDNAAGYVTGALEVAGSATFIRFYKASSLTGNWSAATTSTSVYGEGTIRVA